MKTIYALLFLTLYCLIQVYTIRAQCTETDNEDSSGGTTSFSTGYTYTLETSGTDVIAIIELLDTDKDVGLVAFVQEGTSSEVSMSNIGTRTYQATISGQTDGVAIDIKFRFAYSGGSISTATFSYIVGDNCEAIDPLKDASLSDLQVGGTTIADFNTNIFFYEVELSSTTTAVPTVTVTKSEVTASSLITESTTLPGTTTIVVTSSDGTESQTYIVDFYLDAPLEAAISPLSRDANDVISVFSDAYATSDIAVANFDPDWGQSTDATIVDVDLNSTLLYTSFNYQGIDFGSLQDLTGMTHMHIDVWTNASAIGVSLINNSPAEKRVDLDIIRYQWVSYDILLSEYTSQGLTITDIKEIKFDQGSGSEIIYIDNVYFYNTDVATTPVSPSPYCSTELRHLQATDGQEASAISLTVENIDANSLYVEIESLDADAVDVLIVNNMGSNSSSQNVVSGVFTETLTWTSSIPEEVTFTLLWSKDSEGGNWIASDITVPFLASCTFSDLTISATETSTGDILCGNLIINSEQTLTIDEGHTLTVTGGLTIDGSLIISSGGSLITYDGNTIEEVTIERNTRYSDGKYSFVGTPVEADASNTGSNLGTVVYSYDETVDFGIDDGLSRWKNAASVELVPGIGYAQAFKEQLSFSGVPNDGTIAVSGLSHTENGVDDSNHGWNLVSNPYPAAIDLVKFLDDATNASVIDATAYLWDDNGSDTERGDDSDYLTVNRLGEVGGPNGGLFNGYIGSMQGFFVKVTDETADASINFTENMRVGGVNQDETYFRIAEEDYPSIKLSVSTPSGMYNELLVALKSDATLGKDRIYDASKLGADLGLQFYSLIEDNKYAIQALPIESGVSTELAFDLLEASDLTVSVIEQSLTTEEHFYILDKITGIKYDLNQSSSFTFNAPAGFDQNRFILVYGSENTVLNLSDAISQPLYSYLDNTLSVAFFSTTEIVSYGVYDMAGKAIFKSDAEVLTTKSLNIPISQSGFNIVRIVTLEGVVTKKFLF